MDRKSEDTKLTLFVAVIVIVVLGLLAFSIVRDHIGLNKILSDESGQECQEDMSCWDCETMGNKICGVSND